MAKETDKSGPSSTSEGLFHRIRTGEWPALKIDLSEAYANVRKRARQLRRRRIISAVLVGVVFIWRCQHHPVPVIDIAVFRTGSFRANATAAMVVGAAFWGVYGVLVAFLTRAIGGARLG